MQSRGRSHSGEGLCLLSAHVTARTGASRSMRRKAVCIVGLGRNAGGRGSAARTAAAGSAAQGGQPGFGGGTCCGCRHGGRHDASPGIALPTRAMPVLTARACTDEPAPGTLSVGARARLSRSTVTELRSVHYSTRSCGTAPQTSACGGSHPVLRPTTMRAIYAESQTRNWPRPATGRRVQATNAAERKKLGGLPAMRRMRMI